MKAGVSFVGLVLFSASAFAGSCPDFAGHYAVEDGSGAESTWTQVGCESLVSDGGEPMVLDGREHISYEGGGDSAPPQYKIVQVWSWVKGEIHGRNTTYDLKEGTAEEESEIFRMDARRNLIVEVETAGLKLSVTYRRLGR